MARTQCIACGPCRLYNDFVDSVAIQTQALRETQAVAIADQQKLDEESLQRIKEEDSKAKVPLTFVVKTEAPSSTFTGSLKYCRPCRGA